MITIRAKDFIEGNLNTKAHRFGKGLAIDAGDGGSFARYGFSVGQEGEYEFWSRYASGSCRPADVFVDGALVKKSAMSAVTDGWNRRALKWHRECSLFLKKGAHTLEIRSGLRAPHMEKFSFLLMGDVPTFIKEDRLHFYLSNLARRGFKEGMRWFGSRLKEKLSLAGLKERYFQILGVYDGEYGYQGPQYVQIDVTNLCNNACMACWCNSPLYRTSRLSEKEKNESLPVEMVKSLLDELVVLGVREVGYSGSGEPFMHPAMMEILEYTKQRGLQCLVNTNFTLLTKEKLQRLIGLGVDSLTVSLWAATAPTYVRTHPGRTEEDFRRIKENLVWLNTHKKDKPRVHLYNVLFNMNHFEAQGMVDFAVETKSEFLGFALVDTMPGVTDCLLMDEKQLEELRQACAKIKSQLDEDNRIKGKDVLIYQFDQFLRRISVTTDARQAQYDRNIIDNVPCYNGWLFARVIPNGEVHSCLKAHRIPAGSLYKNKFSEIWNSSAQAHFRAKTRVYKKDDPFFRLIGNDPDIQEAGCYKSCDDIGRNMGMYTRLNMLTLPEKAVLKSLAWALKKGRRMTGILKSRKRP